MSGTQPERKIRTDYFFRSEKVKSTKSASVLRANKNAFDHMQINQYGATSVQIVHDETGEMYTEFKRPIGGYQVKPTFVKDPRNFVTPATRDGMKKAGLLK